MIFAGEVFFEKTQHTRTMADAQNTVYYTKHALGITADLTLQQEPRGTCRILKNLCRNLKELCAKDYASFLRIIDEDPQGSPLRSSKILMKIFKVLKRSLQDFHQGTTP